ncbi:hypothetical protein Moror_14862 [Moniliophthora roreri MCA 2997]|uniref:Uncharacterized protein n=1 Tax=Moniliophthora roreri (strain MCA 2997) TaxID=1381753 RepID=V2WN59_MONRO|nr:hypothetical protein Moror_14862 [Moniliophthora roreri MCA 2997]
MSSAPSIATLGEIGNDLVTSVICTAIETVLITVYTMLVIKAGSILLRIRKGNSEKRVPIVTLAVVAMMYLICLILWITDLVDIVAEIRITLVKDPDVDLDVKYGRAVDFITHRLAAEDLLYGYLTCLGDGVIIWRVYAFWASSYNWKVIIALPVALLLASIACSMMLTYCVARLGGEIVLGSFRDPEFCRNIQTVSYAIPATTTAIATLLIVVKVWSLIRLSRENRIFDAHMSRKSRIESIVILLIESGLAYFLFFLSQAIQNAPAVKAAINAKPNLRFATNVFIYQTSCIVGMYPTIIICLVHAQRSAMDTTLYSTNGRDTKNAGRRGVPISLGSFRAVAPDLSTSARDLESRADVDVQGLHAGPDQEVMVVQKH